MTRQRIVTGIKLIIILFLLLGIGFVSVIEWKGDAIVKKVITATEKNITVPLHYENVHLEWFRYFPAIALRLDELIVGTRDQPLINGGQIDVVLRVWPLLKEHIIINKLLISNADVRIKKQGTAWSYDIFKKTDSSSAHPWNTMIHQIQLENTAVQYDGNEGLSFALQVKKGNIEGELSDDKMDLKIAAEGDLNELKSNSYSIPSPFTYNLSGNLNKDPETGDQHFDEWILKLDGMDIEGSGITRMDKGQEYVDATIQWKNGDAKTILPFLPLKNIEEWEEFKLSGDTEGLIKLNGKSSNHETPHIVCNAALRDGTLHFPGGEHPIREIDLNVTFENEDITSHKGSFLKTNLVKALYTGRELTSEVYVTNLDHPAISLKLKGLLPAALLNVISSSTGLVFREGLFDVDHLIMKGLSPEKFSVKTMVESSETRFTTDKLKFEFNQDKIEIGQGEIILNDAGNLLLTANPFSWNKAMAEEVKGEFAFFSDKVDYTLRGNICKGQVQSIGKMSELDSQPILEADWKMKGVEIREVMSSFDNFDQTFITSENINGKADIWAKTNIPYDASGNIISHKILASAAIDIKNGSLQNMKTLEDFSKYVHLEDLRDIRFNEFRNYLKIENGKVYVPVVFIQSSAINLSVSGIHSFNQEILYNLKINAGQAAANKLRKQDVVKRFKHARKSGWINLYYVLSGTTSDVKYEQDQKEVLSGFEQASALKENLRNYLVDHFGYEVYWLEPNEWEDIPEYE